MMLPAVGALPFWPCPVPPYPGPAQCLTLTENTQNEHIFRLFSHGMLSCFSTSTEDLKVEVGLVGMKETVVVVAWEIFRLWLL